MAILTIGIITLLVGILMIFAALDWPASIIGGGIWSGVFIIIAGSLTIGAGGFEHNNYLRIGAMVMCIFALVFASASGILNLVAFRYLYLYFCFSVFVNKLNSNIFCNVH